MKGFLFEKSGRSKKKKKNPCEAGANYAGAKK